jgi:hypothetical protein
MFEVPTDLTFMPGSQDRLDIGKVLVKRGSADTGLLSYLRHRDGSESLLGYERDGGVLDRLAHLLSVGLDRFGPQLRHPLRIQLVFDTYTLSRKLRHLESKEASMSASPQPPPRPVWVKVSLIVVLVVVAAVVVMAIAGGEHGPRRHLPGGGDHTPPVEHNS